MDQWSVAALVESFCVSTVRTAATRPLIVGLQAPQGAGKTTIARRLLRALPHHGLRGATVSIDDFYLTRAEQLNLAAAHPGNPYLEHRGYPGTHDIELGVTILTALRALGTGQSARVPVYDKSRHGGRGDRAPESDWRLVTGPLDLVLVEGWMLGFEPVPADRLPDPRLAFCNHALADYDRWHRLLDAFIVLRPVDWHYVVDWRIEAEENMKAAGKPGLSRADIEDYVRRFLPAYETWAGRTPARFTANQTITVAIDPRRRVAE